MKMKVVKDFAQSEREDIERLKAIRKAVGDDVAWFEEPVLADDISGLAQIAQATTIPVATGEHEYTKYGFRDLLTAGVADIVQPDIYRVSGITEWMKISAMSDAFNLSVAPHAVSPVRVHCAMATLNIKVVEVLGAEEHSNRVWWTETPPYDGGTWKPFADRPGLGFELNPDALKTTLLIEAVPTTGNGCT